MSGNARPRSQDTIYARPDVQTERYRLYFNRGKEVSWAARIIRHVPVIVEVEIKTTVDAIYIIV